MDFIQMKLEHMLKKTMNKCSGEEVLSSFLYYCGFEDKMDEIIEHCISISTVMLYITSQFISKKISVKPKIIPDSCNNPAFFGQFVELEGYAVFTIKTSVRSAMCAPCKMYHLDKPIVPLFKGQYDIRMLTAALKTALGKEKIEVCDLSKTYLFKIKETFNQLMNAVNTISYVDSYYQEKEENN